MGERVSAEKEIADVDHVERRLGVRLVGATRFIALVPTFGMLFCAVFVVLSGAMKTFNLVAHFIAEPTDTQYVLVAAVEVADTFLLGIVLYIIALGIFSLFIEDRVPLPQWLEFHNLEDLKEKLVGVVVVVLAVFFLGKVIEAKPDAYLSVMYLGVGIAAVVAAVAYFVVTALKHQK